MRTTYAVALTIFLLVAGRPARSQQPAPASGSYSQPSARNPFGAPPGQNDPSPISPAAQERLEKGRQSERQKKLNADTDRLLILATELKADMDKTTKDTLSIEVIKKAEEIEKLAHSVKERMKG